MSEWCECTTDAVVVQVHNDDELTGGLEWIDDDLGIRPPPPPYPETDIGVISSKILEGLSVVALAVL